MDDEENKRATNGNFAKKSASSGNIISNFEDILDHIGGWGLYQIRLLIFMCVMI